MIRRFSSLLPTTCLLTALLVFPHSLRASTARGRVFDEKNQPIAGTTVLIWRNGLPKPVQAVSGVDGTWSAEMPDIPTASAEFPDFYDTEASPDDDTESVFLGRALFVAPGKALGGATLSSGRPAEVHLGVPASVGGQVQNAAGVPVVGASMRTMVFMSPLDNHFFVIPPQLIDALPAQLKTLTDAEGKWKFESVPSNMGVFVLMDDSRFAKATSMINAGQQNAVIVAQPGTILSGRLLFPDGSPAVGLSVYASDADMVKVDEQGRFKLPRVLAGRPNLQVFDPQKVWFAPAMPMSQLEAGQSKDLGDIRLKRSILTKGKVVDENGKGVPGARVSGGRQIVQTREDGSFEMSSTPGFAGIYAQKRNYITINDIRATEIIEGETEHIVPPIVLRRGVTLRGIARDPQGQPAVGAVIHTGNNFDFSSFSSPKSTVANDGTFRLGPLPPGAEALLLTNGAWDIVSGAKIMAPTLEKAEKAPEFAVVLKKLTLAKATGRIVSPDGTPLGGVKVRVGIFLDATHNSRNLNEISSEANGQVSVSDLRPEQSPNVESVLSAGFVLVKAPEVTRDGANWNLGDIVVSPLDGEVRGRVVTNDGTPVAGARVLALTGSFAPKMEFTGADGGFHLQKLPRGEVTILAAQGIGFGRQIAKTGTETEVTLENRPLPTPEDGQALILNEKDDSGLGNLTSNGAALGLDFVLQVFEKKAQKRLLPSLLLNLANSPTADGTQWAIKQWGKLSPQDRELQSGAALARAALRFDKPFAARWLDESRAALSRTDFSAEATNQYFALAGIAGALKRPDATVLVDLGLTAADHSVIDASHEEAAADWGRALGPGGADLIARVAIEIAPTAQVQLLAGAIQTLSALDLDAANALLPQLLTLSTSPEVVAADAKVQKEIDTTHIWHPKVEDALSQTRAALVRALSTRPGPAALDMARLLGNQLRSQTLLQLAKTQIAEGHQADAILTLRELIQGNSIDDDTISYGARLALRLDPALSAELFEKARADLFDLPDQGSTEMYRPSAAIYALNRAEVDAAESRLIVENEWNWRQMLRAQKKADDNYDWNAKNLVEAMGALDLPRALEMLAQIPDKYGQNAQARALIAIYLASNQKTDFVSMTISSP